MAPRILVVDDEPQVLDSLVQILSIEGYDVSKAGGSEDALKNLEARDGGTINLLITDYRMPGMNGVALARKAREIFPRLPIVLMTGSLVTVSEVDLERLGIAFVLRKPFRVAQVHNLVRDLLRFDPVPASGIPSSR